MALPLLNELQERLHACAIAGLNVIGEDFRLARALEQLAQAQASSPVLARIYQTAAPLADPACADKASVLLDAITLVDAVVLTQAGCGVQGELEPMAAGCPGIDSGARYSELSALYTALTTRGSGRYEILRTALDENRPALRDFRLMEALAGALGDSYSEIADLAARILSTMPQAVPLLKRGLDPASKKKDMVRRIDIIQAAARARENALYLRLAEEGSTVIQEAAVRALRHDPANIPLLIEYVGKAKGGVRSAALEALSQMRGGQVDAFWLDRLTAAGVSADTLKLVYGTDSDLVSDAVADLLVRLADEADAADSQPCPQEREAYVHNLLRAIVHKTSPKLFAALEQLGASPAMRGGYISDESMDRIIRGMFSISGIPNLPPARFTPLMAVNFRLIQTMLDNPAAVGPVQALYSRCGEPYRIAGFAAALLTDTEAAYDGFEPFFGDPGQSEPLLWVMRTLYYNSKTGRTGIAVESIRRVFTDSLGIRWLRMILKYGHWRQALGQPLTDHGYTAPSWFSRIVNPHDAESCALLRPYLLGRVGKSGVGFETLYDLRHCGQQDFSGLIPKTLKSLGDAESRRIGRYIAASLYDEFPMPEQTKQAELTRLQEEWARR